MIFGVYWAARPHFFHPKIRDICAVTCCVFHISQPLFTELKQKYGTWRKIYLSNHKCHSERKVSYVNVDTRPIEKKYRTQSAQAFSSHPATWASLVSKSLGTMRSCRAFSLHNSHLTYATHSIERWQSKSVFCSGTEISQIALASSMCPVDSALWCVLFVELQNVACPIFDTLHFYLKHYSGNSKEYIYWW